MTIEPGKYQLTVTRTELLALNRALEELETMRCKYPDERNGYDCNTASLAGELHRQISNVLTKDRG
jgi:hypothetical protein